MDIIKKIEKYINEIKEIKKNKNTDIIKIKNKFCGKNGIINIFLKHIKKTKDKKYLGKKINILKKEVFVIINKKKNIYKNNIKKEKINNDFFYIKKKKYKLGSKNPITLIKEKIINILCFLKFDIIYGREIEDDWHNFKALNFPKYHPSRDMQDTFYINKNILLRTHTSSVQIRYMEKNKPPIRIITFGKVYRNESISKSSYNMFHQIEVLYVDKNVSIIDLKNLINYLIINIFGISIKYRYRISYFPFTKPSFEIDIYYNKKWIEIIGCGLVNKKVLNNVNLDSKNLSGFAFGIGVERIAMIIYKIKDIREFFKNDIRFIKQFKSELLI
ncbi:MAG: phenylalanine--tRNA ligase subunit alpha [Candidatus Shikimatogenerans bostrichidophilus]|nr:MAG: phenylalanine--tRNA ligase subunit alpha [Candidatus Shikimatogenerans bostrichidophilus]